MAGTPGGRSAGRVSIRVVPDSTEFRRDLRRSLERIERTESVSIRVDVDTAAMRQKLRDAARDLAVDVRLNTAAATAEFRALWASFQAYARANPIPVPLDPDTARFDTQLRTLLRNRTLTVGVNTRGTGFQFLDRLLSRTRNSPFGRLAASLSGLARTAALTSTILAGLAVTLNASVVTVGALTGAVQQLSGVFALLPALSLAGFAALGTLALGFTGLADATGSAGQVRDVVRGLKGEFQNLRGVVQENLFVGLTDSIRELAQGWLPVLTTGLGAIATEFNRLAQNILGVLSSQQSLTDGASGLANTAALVSGLAAAAPSLVAALRDIAVVGSEFFPAFGDGIRDAAAQFAAFIAGARSDGSLEAFIRNGIAGIGQLTAALGNIGRAFGGLFTAANVDGAGFLGTLEKVTGAFADLINSTGAQAGLSAFFGGVQAGVDALLSALGDTLPSMLSTFGPLLGTITSQVGSVLGAAVRAIAPVVEVLAPAFDAFFATVGPALTGLVAALSPALQGLAGSLIPVIQVLGDTLAPVLSEIAPLLGQFATTAGALFAKLATGVIPQVGDLLVALIPSFEALLPAVEALATELIDALLPVLPQLVAAVVDFTPVLVQILGLLAQYAPIIGVVVGAIASLVGAFLNWATNSDFANRSMVASRAMLTLFSRSLDITVPIVKNFGAVVAGIFRTVQNIGTAAFTTLSGAVTSRVAAIAATAAQVIAFKNNVVAAFTSLASGAIANVAQVVGAVQGLPARIRTAVGDLGRVLYGAGRNVVQGLIDGIRSMLGAVGSAVSGIADRVRSYFPFSPAKRGPLRTHPMSKAGANLVRDLLTPIDRAQGLAGRYSAGLAASITNPFAAGADGVQVTGGGSGQTINFNGNVGWDPDTVAQRINARSLDAQLVANLGGL